MTIRVLLADDHKILREALKGILEREHDITLVGEACDGAEALELAKELLPDVVLMDIGMPVMGGIESARNLIALHDGVKVIALSTFSERRIVTQMLDAGARGYIVKSAGRDELLRAIRAVAHGRTYLCPESSAVLVDSMLARNPGEQAGGERLGRREREVLKLLADGQTSPKIGQALHIATSTVEVHRRNIMRKLDLHSVAELTKYAIRNGLTSS
ncbi:MAG: response regulator transcription factor [Dechloromonas sp.]|nr:response regulator transcription factor [Dechloromonas sp.]